MNDQSPLVQHRSLKMLGLASRSPREDVEADVASTRGLSHKESGERLAAVCRAAWSILRSRPDFAEIVAYSDPLPPDFEAKWAALIVRHRAQQRAEYGPR